MRKCKCGLNVITETLYRSIPESMLYCNVCGTKINIECDSLPYNFEIIEKRYNNLTDDFMVAEDNFADKTIIIHMNSIRKEKYTDIIRGKMPLLCAINDLIKFYYCTNNGWKSGSFRVYSAKINNKKLELGVNLFNPSTSKYFTSKKNIIILSKEQLTR